MAEAAYWVARATAWEGVRPRSGDHPGGPVDWVTGEPVEPPAPDPGLTTRAQGMAEECRARAEECHAIHQQIG
jgi:hypothetical protein